MHNVIRDLLYEYWEKRLNLNAVGNPHKCQRSACPIFGAINAQNYPQFPSLSTPAHTTLYWIGFLYTHTYMYIWCIGVWIIDWKLCFYWNKLSARAPMWAVCGFPSINWPSERHDDKMTIGQSLWQESGAVAGNGCAQFSSAALPLCQCKC